MFSSLRYLLTSSSDGLVKIWDFKNRILLHNFGEGFHAVCKMSSGGEFFLLTSSIDNSCHIIDTETGKIMQKLENTDGGKKNSFFVCLIFFPTCRPPKIGTNRFQIRFEDFRLSTGQLKKNPLGKSFVWKKDKEISKS